MTARKATCLPPAMMWNTELERCLVGDGSGGRELLEFQLSYLFPILR